MKHKELTGRIIECAYQVYKKRLASFVYPACRSEAKIPLSGPRSSPWKNRDRPEDGTGVGPEDRTGVPSLRLS